MFNFTVEKIQKDILRITESYYLEHANIYVFTNGINCLVIDPGLGFGDLRKFLKHKGYSVFITTATHSHFDHAGGLKHFTNEEIFLTDRIIKNLHQKNLRGLSFLSINDFAPEVKDIFLSNISSFDATPVSKIKPWNANELVLGTFHFKIISTPGHTDDSMILFDDTNKILISGDTLYDGEPYWNFPNSDRKNLGDSLKLISELDFNFLLPGHNQILTKLEALEVIKKWRNKINE